MHKAGFLGPEVGKGEGVNPLMKRLFWIMCCIRLALFCPGQLSSGRPRETCTKLWILLKIVYRGMYKWSSAFWICAFFCGTIILF